MKDFWQKNHLYFAVTYAIVFCYLLFIAPFRMNTYTGTNFVPFRTLYSEIIVIIIEKPSWSYITFVVGGILGNFFLLLPLPILFNIQWQGLKKWLLIILLPITIEFLQYIFQTGSADVDDLILNASGCATGFYLMRRIRPFPAKY